jgi:multiple sugar transport system permease protein
VEGRVATRVAPGAAPRKRRGLSLRARREVWAWTFLTPPLLFYLLLRIAPTLWALRMSFYHWQLPSLHADYIGVGNFVALAHDDVFRDALENTAKYVLVGVLAQLALGLAVGLCLTRVVRGAALYRVVYFMPYLTVTTAAGFVFTWLYAPDRGLFNQVLGLLHLPPQQYLNSPAEAIYAVIGFIVWQGIGFYAIIFLAGLENIPRSFYDAAIVDGAGRWQIFRHITLPLLNPTIVLLAVVGTIGGLQVFAQVYALSSQGGGGPLHNTLSMVLFIYQQAFGSFNMGYALAATVVLFLVILLVTVVQLKVFSREVEY